MSTLELLKGTTSLGETPESIEAEVVKIVPPENPNLSVKIKSDIFNRVKGQAFGLLKKHPAEIPTAYRYELSRLIRQMAWIEPRRLEGMRRFISAMEENGIPGIWDSTFESRFNLEKGIAPISSADFVIQIVCGSYMTNLINNARILGPSSVHEILDFRKKAFDDAGKIKPTVRRHINWYVHNRLKTENPETVSESNQRAFDFLEEKLGGLTVAAAQRKDQTTDNIDFIFINHHQAWYLDFTEAGIQKIIDIFLTRYEKGEINNMTKKSRTTISLMSDLFPEINQRVKEIDSQRNRISAKEGKKQTMEYRSAIEEILRDAEQIMTANRDLVEILKGKFNLKEEEAAEIIDQFKVKRLAEISDDLLVDIYYKHNNAFEAMCSKANRNESSVYDNSGKTDRQFNKRLVERARSLVTSGKLNLKGRIFQSKTN